MDSCDGKKVELSRLKSRVRLALFACRPKTIPDVSLNFGRVTYILLSADIDPEFISSHSPPIQQSLEVLWGCIIISGQHPVRAPET